ncbi:hypothetical protein C5167_026703 [Papaver somniferum]|nr:hypothetical protein C5167_026703 [Papaver somniferum]
MASFCAVLVYNLVFLLVSTVSASMDDTSVVGSAFPSLEIGVLTDTPFKCDSETGVYTSKTSACIMHILFDLLFWLTRCIGYHLT